MIDPIHVACFVEGGIALHIHFCIPINCNRMVMMVLPLNKNVHNMSQIERAIDAKACFTYVRFHSNPTQIRKCVSRVFLAFSIRHLLHCYSNYEERVPSLQPQQ